MNAYFQQRSRELAPALVAWRRDFHQYPELGFQERRTAGLVAAHLRQLGLEVRTGIGRTGVVALVEGRGPGPTVLLRFDMDALPVAEATGLPFASRHEGVMHACGHDGHTAIGMAVAQMLVETAAHWPGRVKLLFQPAEEGLGGAAATIADGVLADPPPDLAFGLHLWNALPVGQVVAQSGPLMAAADRFTLIITGRGGHGGMPHTTVDAVLVASQAVTLLQSIVSRNLPPQEAAVLSVGSFHAGDAFNVIAETAVLTGTLRTLQSDVRATLIRRMEEMLDGLVRAHGASYTLELADHTPALVNDPEATRLAAAAAATVVAPAQLTTIAPLMVAEDMAEFLRRVPGCYLLVGARPDAATVGPHHSPRFDLAEEALPLAAAILATVAVAALRRS
jgi:amidohydrolase